MKMKKFKNRIQTERENYFGPFTRTGFILSSLTIPENFHGSGFEFELSPLYLTQFYTRTFSYNEKAVV